MARRTIATVRRPRTHLYTADQAAPADRTGVRPCRCGLPARNTVHAPAADVDQAQAEHLRRIGNDP